MALLLGFEEEHVVLWRIFSRVAKLSEKLKVDGRRNEQKVLYNFHESVIGAMKPFIIEGVRSIVVVSPTRTTYAKEFLEHVKKHHRYLIQLKSSNRVNFAELVGSADDRLKVVELVKTKEFKDLITETTSEESRDDIFKIGTFLRSRSLDIEKEYKIKDISIINIDKIFIVSFDLCLHRFLSLQDSHMIADKLAQLIKEKFPSINKICIHLEPL